MNGEGMCPLRNADGQDAHYSEIWASHGHGTGTFFCTKHGRPIQFFYTSQARDSKLGREGLTLQALKSVTETIREINESRHIAVVDTPRKGADTFDVSRGQKLTKVEKQQLGLPEDEDET